MKKLIIAAILLAGCATAQRSTMLAEDALSRVTTAGYLALDQYDSAKVSAIAAKAESGDLSGAKADAMAYGPIRNKAIGALDAAAALLQAAEEARQGAGAAASDPKAYLGYLPQFVKAAADIAGALKDAGVKLPDALSSALSTLGAL